MKLSNVLIVCQHNSLMDRNVRIVQLIVLTALNTMDFVKLALLLLQFRATVIPVDVHLVLFIIKLQINVLQKPIALPALSYSRTTLVLPAVRAALLVKNILVSVKPVLQITQLIRKTIKSASSLPAPTKLDLSATKLFALTFPTTQLI
jgi:hypothetical protein